MGKKAGSALHSSADALSGMLHISSIPLKFLANDCAVAWEKRTPDGIKIRTRCIGAGTFEDLSDFENTKPLPQHQRASIKFVDSGVHMKTVVTRAEEAGYYYSDSDDSDDDYSY